VSTPNTEKQGSLALSQGPAGAPGQVVEGSAAVADEEGSSRPGLDSGLNPRTLLAALRRRWLIASILGLVCGAAAAAAGWYLMPVKYTARALLYVAASPQSVVFPGAESRTDFAIYQRTQIGLITSRPVLNAALKEPGVRDLPEVQQQLDPVEWLKKKVVADYNAGPEMLSVGTTAASPDQAALLANAVTKAYMSEIVDKERNKRLVRLDQLKEVSNKYEALLQRKREAFKTIAEPLGTGDAQTAVLKQRFAQEQLAVAEKELLQLQSDVRKWEIELGVLRAREKAAGRLGVRDADVEEFARGDRVVAKLAAQKDRLEALIHETLPVVGQGEQDPAIRKYRADLEEVERQLVARRQEIRPQLEEQLRARAVETSADARAQLEERIALSKKLEESLESDVKRLRADARSLGRGSMSLESYREEIAQTEDVAKKVAAMVETLTVELEAPSRVTQLEEAVPPAGHDRKQKMMAAAGGGSGALACMLLLVAWLESRSRRISSVEEVIHGLGMRLLGTLPARPQRRGLLGRAQAERSWRDRLTESVDSARAVLLHAARQHQTRVVMVTSAVGGEGKTSLATQLAASLARAGRKTLLLDFDLRNPAAHRPFDLPRSPGLAELLRGQATLDAVLHPAADAALTLLPAGECDEAAVQALAREDLADLFARLRERFDFVIVDSSPVLPVADSLLVAQHVDGVIFSILHEVSRLPHVYAAYQRLDMLGIRLLGAAVSGTHESLAYYGSRDRAAAEPEQTDLPVA
jgi:capsular exopolysaccharide synthesis family protein